jgi:hypothetical protein
VAVVNAIPERLTEVLFALLMLYVAQQLVRRALAPGPDGAPPAPDVAAEGGG